MIFSWIIALVTVNYLHLHTVTAQFGVYFDNTINSFRYYRSLTCRVSNMYPRNNHVSRSHYTVRGDINCCYMTATRNKCCEETTYNFATHQFTYICKCDPQVTCQTTVPTTTKIPPRPLFCPVVGARIINSVPVSDKCGGDFPGVFRVVRKNGASSTKTVCNAVLAMAYVKGIRKMTLVTSEYCKRVAEGGFSWPSTGYGIEVSPSLMIPYSKFNKISGKDDAAFFDPVDEAILLQLTSSCKKTACGLRNPDMMGKIDYNDCQVLSYGSVSKYDVSKQDFRSIRVRIYPQGCRLSPKNNAQNAMCFTTKDQVPIICSSDFGAPVFCKSSTTDENIVVGVLAGEGECGAAPSFRVVQYPTF